MWFPTRKVRAASSTPSHRVAFRPRLEALEERALPSAAVTLLGDLNAITHEGLPAHGNLSTPEPTAVLDGSAYFAADGGVNGGRGLWRSDGTAAGTSLVANFNGSVRNLTLSGGALFFSAEGSSADRQLWTSDGSVVEPVTAQQLGLHSDPRFLTDVNGTLFFTAWDSSGNRQLWRSNGTRAGTIPLMDLSNFGDTFDPFLTNVGGTAYFRGFDPATGVELWKSDGTEGGTVLVQDIRPGGGSSGPLELTGVGGTLFFLADNGVHGRELWRSDGTAAGTVLVQDIRMGPQGNDFSELIKVSGSLFLTADDGTTGKELWTSDGTAAGTVPLDLRPGSLSSSPRFVQDVNGTLYFFADDGTHGNGLYKTDGTLSGTAFLATVSPSAGIHPWDYQATGVALVGGRLFFVGNTGLWASDGTAAGTGLVKSVALPLALTDLHGTLLFSAFDPQVSRELWRSDGTTAGTVLVKDINTDTFDSDPFAFTPSNGQVYFTTRHRGPELWRTDGTPAGTVSVRAFTDHPSWNIQNLTDVTGTLYFTLHEPNFSATENRLIELWQSDGTAVGTVRLSVFSGRTVRDMQQVNGALWFVRVTYIFSSTLGVGPFGSLWTSDGTEAGTTNVTPHLGITGPLTAVNGTFYFSATNGLSGSELWKSDGTTAGTTLVKDVWPGGGGSGPDGFAVMAGALYFTADDGSHGRELWKTDGSTAGTVLVADVRPGTASSNPESLTPVGGTLYFAADDGTHGIGLWKSDGTLPEVQSVTPLGAVPTQLTDVNGTLFFSALNGLWRSNGTAASTLRVKTITVSGEVAAAGGRLYFSGYDPAVGHMELWTSDGTATIRIADLTPTAFKNVNGKLYFRGTDQAHGSEPWVLDTASLFQSAQIAVSRGSINLGSNGSITVTVFGSSDFDAALVDALSIDFAGAFAYQSALQDTDGDGRLDLILHFRVQDTMLRGLYEQLLEEDMDGDGVLNSTNQTAQVSLAGSLLGGDLFESAALLNLSLSGRELRDLLDTLFAA